MAYVRATREAGGGYRVQRFGVERQGDDSPQAFAGRLAALGLRGRAARAMLRPEQYQMLQIEAPAVAPDELRTAARYQIRDMVDMHLDDLTLDVIRVGDERVRATGHLFVVAASNALIREVMGVGQSLRRGVAVIDIQEMAQRNLQSAWVRRNGTLERAHAALVVTDDRQALLTISAYEELFYTRRIDLGEDFLGGPWGGGESSAQTFGDEPAPSAAAGGDAQEPELGVHLGDADRRQRVVVEIQRSLDLWDRTWPMLTLDQFGVYAGERTGDLARWLGQELGQAVTSLDLGGMFPGFEGGTEEDRRQCWPLLGVLLRTEGRRL